MSTRYRPVLALLGLIAGVTGLVGTTPAKAQAPWAESNYAFRRPLTVTNPTASTIAAGDIIAYSFSPGTGGLANARPDGKDVKLSYYNGTTNVPVPQTLLNMGAGNAKLLFPAQAAIAAAPPPVVENASAGTTSYASLPGTTIIPAVLNGDDGGSTVTLPFSFPFGNTSSDKIFLSIDGYLVPGTDQPISLYGRANANRPGIYPYTSDYTVEAASAGAVGAKMTYATDNNGPGGTARAIFKWEVAQSGATAIIAKFAAILYPSGDVRFVYSDLVTPTGVGVGDAGSYGEMSYGVEIDSIGSGVIHFPTDAYPSSADLSNHPDILYTQSHGGTQATGYWLYYGYTMDDGVTGRTAPDPTKVVMYDFNDGTTQGWTKASVNTETTLVEAATYLTEKTLHVQTSSGGHPAALAAGQTSLLGDCTVYSRIACANSDEIGIGARTNDSGGGYYNVLDGFGSLETIVQRTSPGGSKDYDIISNTVGYATGGVWNYDMMRVTGTGASISILGRAWKDGALDPGTWQVSGTPNLASAQYDTGVLGLTGWSGDKYIDWVCATGPNAEVTTGVLGTEEGSPSGSVIRGTVRDVAYRVEQPGAKVVLTNASGMYVLSTLTNVHGAFAIYLPTAGSFSIASLGGGRGARSTVTVPAGGTVNVDLLLDVPANGDCEVPTADNSWPDQWESYQFSAGGPATIQALSNEQNHTPGGHWSLKIQGVKGDSTSFQTGIGRTGNQLFQHPILPGCSYTLSAWVYFTNSGDRVRFRLRNGWPIAGFFVTAGSPPDANNENTGGLDGSGNVPVGQWYQMKRTWTYTPGGSANPLPIEYGLYTFAAQAGTVYFDDVTLTPTPVSLNMVVAKVVDSQGAAVASPYVGEMRYNGTLFSMPVKSNEAGVARFLTTSTSAIALAAWKGPDSTAATKISANGYLVSPSVAATPSLYDPNATTPTVTIVWDNKPAIQTLGAGTSTPIFGTSQWPAYLIDKRIDKTGVTDPGDSTNTADWVQVKRNPDNFVAGLCWDTNIDGEWNGWGSGGLRGILSSAGGVDIPDRYRTTTFEIDLGRTQVIDQLEFGYFFAINKHRVWISDTPFTWNVELPDSQAIINTTTDATSVAAQGFTSKAPYADSAQLSEYLVYRLAAPAVGRYLRIRQDGAPFGDGHQILLEMRAMSNAALPKPVVGRVVDTTGTPVAGAFVGPFPTGGPGDFAKTAADGTFTWTGPGYPTNLYAHVEAKNATNYDPTPYMAAGPYLVTPKEGGANIGDMVVYRSGGNAMLGASTVVVANDGNTGTETYSPVFYDPSEPGHDVSKLTDGLAGDANQWAAKPDADKGDGLPYIGLVTGGPNYLRFGLESTLTAPADLDEIDVYWFQNGFSAGWYLQTSSDNGTTWSTVYDTTNYAGNYSDSYPNDGLRVAVAKFATKTAVNKVRVIFSTISNRNGGADNEYIINEIVALKHTVPPMTAADVNRALQIAGGLVTATAADKARLDTNGDNKIDLLDAAKLNKSIHGL